VKRLSLIFAVLAVLLIGAGLGFFISQTSKSNPDQSGQNQSVSRIEGEKTGQQLPSPTILAGQRIKVIRIIDGDTIEIEGGQKVRYIGINAPETVHPDMKVQCFGKEAAVKNKELIEGKIIELEKDVSETDKYGRLLRYIYSDNIFVNDFLVRQGFAHASTYPPDVKYQDQFRQAEQEAQEFNRGLWGVCQSTSSQPSSSSQPSDCLIKGNISSSGEKIYHMPGQRYYDKTVIDENKGERWFCSEDEAVSAGWRKSKI